MRTSIRLMTFLAALALSLASAGGNQEAQNGQTAPPPAYGTTNNGAPVQSQPMAESKALGLWKSSFGAVKLEREPARPNTLRGVWVYQRNGEEVIGYFTGSLSGNTLSFSWEEPTSTGSPLFGGGYLVFDPAGQSFQGKWWTTARDRGGDWSGWRANGAMDAGGDAEQAPDEDAPDDDAPEPTEPTGNGDFI